MTTVKRRRGDQDKRSVNELAAQTNTKCVVEHLTDEDLVTLRASDSFACPVCKNVLKG